MTIEGLTPEQARARSWLFDINGLVESTRADLADFQQPYAHLHAPSKDFVQAIESLKPAAIIGVSTVAKAFNQRVIEAMARINQHPSSSPTRIQLRTPNARRKRPTGWSEGRAIFASGRSPASSPFVIPGAGVTPAEGSAKPTAGFAYKLVLLYRLPNRATPETITLQCEFVRGS